MIQLHRIHALCTPVTKLAERGSFVLARKNGHCVSTAKLEANIEKPFQRTLVRFPLCRPILLRIELLVSLLNFLAHLLVHVGSPITADGS